jgi:hypothetical protein
MTNENVLAGIQCPECESYGPFHIQGSAQFLDVTDDGCTDFTDMSWTDESHIHCVMCSYNGKIHEFGGDQ